MREVGLIEAIRERGGGAVGSVHLAAPRTCIAGGHQLAV